MSKLSLNTRIIVCALLGILLGLSFRHFGANANITLTGLYWCDLISSIFISMLKMVMIPLVFLSIVVGVSQLQAHHQMHRVWISTLIFFAISMFVAIVLGMASIHLFNPAGGLHLAMFEHAMTNFNSERLSINQFLTKFIGSLFVNPIKAMAEGNILAVVIFALLIGIAIVKGGNRYQHIQTTLQQLLDLIMQIVGWIMQLAPFGILALLAKLTATQDVSLFASLGKFMLVIIGITIIHGAVALPSMLYVVTRISPLHFFKGARQALITAFATSSSAATLPVTLRCLQTELHVQPNIAQFVAPLGSQINMDGTALYEASAALFIASLAGIDLNFGQQLVVCFTAMVAAIGAPGIPSAGMVTMIMVLQSVGLPIEALGLLLPIDRILDTVRTVVNVQGDMVGSLIVQRIANKKQENT